jgi:hypothetical protein
MNSRRIIGNPLKKLPKEHKFAFEIRNKDWLVPKLADVLREHGVALTLIDQGWMPRPWEMKTVTADSLPPLQKITRTTHIYVYKGCLAINAARACYVHR